MSGDAGFSLGIAIVLAALILSPESCGATNNMSDVEKRQYAVMRECMKTERSLDDCKAFAESMP